MPFGKLWITHTTEKTEEIFPNREERESQLQYCRKRAGTEESGPPEGTAEPITKSERG